MSNIPSYAAPQPDVDAALAAAGPRRGEYTRYAQLEECPRCFMGTHGETACPTCGLDLSDANIAAEEAVRGQNLSQRGRALSYVLLACVVMAVTAPIFYSMGRRSVAVAQAAQQEDLAASAKQVWRGLDDPTRLALKRRDYMTLLNPDSVGRVTDVSFAPIPIANQAAVAGVPDLSLLLNDDKAWQQLPEDMHLVVIGAISKYHQSFLSDAGYADTTRYAVQIVAPDGQGHLRRLARRDRDGHLTVAPVVASSNVAIPAEPSPTSAADAQSAGLEHVTP